MLNPAVQAIAADKKQDAIRSASRALTAAAGAMLRLENGKIFSVEFDIRHNIL
jgi:hypothetical protein